MPTLSIIVPVYNAEQYLERCISSILGQSFKDFELIIVNDGSTDDSSSIINKFAALDSRVVMIDSENRGVSNARNLGLEASKGTYVGFVDSDDFIDPNMYQLLLNSIYCNHTELSCCWMNFTNSEVNSRNNHSIPAVMTNKEFIRHIFDLPITVYSSVCNKVFLRNLITEKFDTNLIMDEDTRFLVHYSRNIERASFVDYIGYHYNRNDKSLTIRDPGNIVKSLPPRRVLVEELKDFSEDVFRDAEKSFLDRCCCGISNSLIYQKIEYYHIAKKELLIYIRKHLGHILLNQSISWKLKVIIMIRTIQCLLLK